ncbi:MAG TPA: heparinase, partial [Dysgonomonas sp.]|nr:heparinase [Dysgonomonas sp.]
DSFDISEPADYNILHFISWGDIDISEAGKIKITVEDKTIQLIYDIKEFEPGLEEIRLDDKRLSNVWGDKIYRIILKAKKLQAKGKYNIIIK